MTTHPTSKSQTRALSLLAITPASDDYSAAGDALDRAGFWKDGIPEGHTWRTAAKLTDAELVTLLLSDRTARAGYAANRVNDRDIY